MRDRKREAISLDLGDDRYARLRMIPWWNQERLRQARVVVVGAGALGNEIIKNLALVGVGSILIVDFDRVEETNLSRSVLYRHEDSGRPKARTAARAAKQIGPDCSVFALEADVTKHVGDGVYRWADVVICGLDSREARLAVNRACWRVNTPWVDGATESLQGIARVFVPPEGPCYECTLSEQDERLMAARNSCGFLAEQAYRQGRAPTTPTAAAVVAGVQVQEALKLLHPDSGLAGLAGKGFFFDGGGCDWFTVEYVRRRDCLSHETYDIVVETGLESSTATLRDVLREARDHLGADAVIDLPSDLATTLRCSHCNQAEEIYALLRCVGAEEARCGVCGELRVPDVTAECRDSSVFVDRTLAELRFGIMEILGARSADNEIAIEISGDRKRVFGGCVERPT